MKCIRIQVNDRFAIEVSKEGVRIEWEGNYSLVLTHAEFDQLKSLPFCSLQAAFRADNPALTVGVDAYGSNHALQDQMRAAGARLRPFA